MIIYIAGNPEHPAVIDAVNRLKTNGHDPIVTPPNDQVAAIRAQLDAAAKSWVRTNAYKLDGTRLWRINLGKNIRAGAHYTQFQVYDLDGVGTSRRHLGREQHMGGRATAAACPPGAHRHPGPTKTA